MPKKFKKEIKSKQKSESKPKSKLTSKPIGTVTHFYGNIGVAIIKFKSAYKLGKPLKFKGATTDFEGTPESMEYNHKAIKAAKKGQEVGIKVNGKVREGDLVYLV